MESFLTSNFYSKLWSC